MMHVWELQFSPENSAAKLLPEAQLAFTSPVLVQTSTTACDTKGIHLASPGKWDKISSKIRKDHPNVHTKTRIANENFDNDHSARK